MKDREKFFKRLREGIFGRELAPEPPTVRRPSISKPKPQAPVAPPAVFPIKADGREPQIIQIGLDFGTSFSKCVCRDVVKGKAWVHIPDFTKGAELPFLIPSAVLFQNGILRRFPDSSQQYAEGALYHLKLALERIAHQDFRAPVLAGYRKAFGNPPDSQLARSIEAVTIYLLGSMLADIRSSLLRRSPFQTFGKHPEDYVAANMAIPVADAENSLATASFERVLRTAWVLAPELNGYPDMRIGDLLASIATHGDQAATAEVGDACFVYPEVSANVQGFVRSRSSSPGVYLFADTGAGTVDQSIFEFIRHDPSHGVLYFPGPAKGEMDGMIKKWVNSGDDYLRYFSAAVLPIGSSQIESLAVQAAAQSVTSESLERWRLLKESGSNAAELLSAATSISRDLSHGTASTLSHAKRKVYSPTKLYDIRLVFGGGGHCDNPYARGVISAFPRVPDVVGVPHSKDLDLGSGNKRWLPRLSVAYGLSFQKADLAKFSCPTDLPDVALSRSHA
jgi:hypothetical protein